MKVFILLLLFGIASAYYLKDVNEAADGYLVNLVENIDQSRSLLKDADYNAKLAEQIDGETKEVGRKLRDALNNILEKIRKALELGEVVERQLWVEIGELIRQLREAKEDIGDKAKEILEKIKEKAKERVKNILEKFKKDKRDVDDKFYKVDKEMSELNIRDILTKIKEHIKKTVDPELLKEKIEKLFGQGSELLHQLLQTLKEKGRHKMMILIDALLEDDDDDDGEVERQSRGIKDYWEKVKDYFKDLKIDLQEKYMKFGEWVKNTFDKGWEHSKDKMENIKAIAKEFLKHAKGISKEVATEAGEFFRNYKEELGNVWEEIKERIAEIKNKKE